MRRDFLLSLIILCVGCGSGAFCSTVAVANKSAKEPQLKTSLPMITPDVGSSVSLSPADPQKIDFAACSKSFKTDGQKLFYLTLSAVKANRYNIDEIQSESGYIVFSVAQKQFLASVISIDYSHSMLKITPCNNIYYFPLGIVQNMFKYIELNLNAPIEKLTPIGLN